MRARVNVVSHGSISACAEASTMYDWLDRLKEVYLRVGSPYWGHGLSPRVRRHQALDSSDTTR